MEIEGGAFLKGTKVHLKADPSILGVITSRELGGAENRYEVFLNNASTKILYESQLVAVSPRDAGLESLPLDRLRARLTAIQILNPSTEHLYSLSAARIEFVPYQFRPVLKFLRADQPRFLIADSVGVGKTIEAGLILRELQARQTLRRVMVLCPRPLVTESKWRNELKRFDEDFVHLDGKQLRYCINETWYDGEWPERYDRVIVPYSLITQDLLEGEGRQKGLLDLDPPPHFDLLILDEAHSIRNPTTLRHLVARYLCENATAVLFLTATPIQLRIEDLFVLLNTLRPDVFLDMAAFGAITEPNPYINRAATLAREGGEGWREGARQELAEAAETAWGSSFLEGDSKFQGVCAQLDRDEGREARVATIRDIEDLHTLSPFMNRTLRRDIGEFTKRNSVTVEIEFSPEQRELHDLVLETHAEAFRTRYGERSVRFFLSMIRRQAASCISGLAPFLEDILANRFTDLEWLEFGEEEGADSEMLQELLTETVESTRAFDQNPDRDPKFLALLQILDEKLALEKHRTMVFSTFRHTLAYLHRALVERGYRVGLVHGGVPDMERLDLKVRFELERDDEEALDVLLFSEVGCEGLDYQFCDCLVNYDLPWNPMRIDQRIGRIDRWGQESEVIAIYNLITKGTVDAEIYGRCLMRIGVFERALGANELILAETTSKLKEVAENFTLTEDERNERLSTIADNAVRETLEQENLEEQQMELFGLRLPAARHEEDVERASSHWLSPESLERLIRQFVGELSEDDTPSVSGSDPDKRLSLEGGIRRRLLDVIGNSDQSRETRKCRRQIESSDAQLPVCFDAESARRSPDSVHITAVHPLSKLAAHASKPSWGERPFTRFEVRSEEVPSGEYLFCVYQWDYMGIRPDTCLVTVADSPDVGDCVLRLLSDPSARDLSGPETDEREFGNLEELQHEKWSQARKLHVEQVRKIADVQRRSLEESGKAQIELLEQQKLNELQC